MRKSSAIHYKGNGTRSIPCGCKVTYDAGFDFVRFAYCWQHRHPEAEIGDIIGQLGELVKKQKQAHMRARELAHASL